MIGRTHTDLITVKDVPAAAFIKAYAEHLKKTQKIHPVDKHEFLKTGFSREISPHDEDWFYTRTASLARKIYLRPGLGVGALKHIFGKNGRNGHRRNHHTHGSGKVIRYALQQLQDADVLMSYNDKRNKHISSDITESEDTNFPRVVTPQGQKELNEIAKQVFKNLYGAE